MFILSAIEELRMKYSTHRIWSSYYVVPEMQLIVDIAVTALVFYAGMKYN